MYGPADYFKEHPEAVLELLSALHRDESGYVRKSIGNALRDIGKKYPQLVEAELHIWDLTKKKVRQADQLASRFLLELPR